MRAVLMLLAAIAIVIAGTAVAAMAREPCDEDSIETIAEDGDLIVLASGATFNVARDDQPTASLWQEGDDVLVCGRRTVIDKDQGNERIRVRAH